MVCTFNKQTNTASSPSTTTAAQTTTTPISQNDILDESHTIELIGTPNYGTADLVQSGSDWNIDYQYNNSSSSIGTDSIKYQIINSFNKSDTATVYFNLNPVYTMHLGFDYHQIPSSGYLNGSNVFGGFISLDNYLGFAYAYGGFLHNSYNPAWDSWSGNAISNLNDIQTEGYSNQYSVFDADNQSNNFLIVNGNSEANTIEVNTETGIKRLKIANSTYVALSMQNGDAFAKKFGGDDGNDPDWFKITIGKLY